MEQEGVEADLREIRKSYDLSSGEVTGIPSAMLFNLDETGHQDWADRRSTRVVVPVSYQDDSN
jgi:hypothetical protein